MPFTPQPESPTHRRASVLYSPNPLIPRVAQFLDLRSNSVDTTTTEIEQDAMSIRSESVSPMTVPGAAISVYSVRSRSLPEGAPAGLGIRVSTSV